MPTRRALAVAVLAAVVVACVATAGPPGTWTRAGKRPGSAEFAAGLARTADGVLHIVSLRVNGANTDLWQVRIGSDGRLLGSNAIVHGWSQLANPDLVVTRDGGLRVLFGGDRVADDATPGFFTATAPAAGGPWTAQPDPFVPGPDAATADITSTIAKDGAAIAAWTDPGGLHYRFGLDPGAREVVVADCCANAAALATDPASGQAYLGWASSTAAASGIFVAPVGPRAAGRALLAPGSASKTGRAIAPNQPIALAARLGGGVWAAYGAGFPTVRAVVLWRVGAPKPLVRVPSLHASLVALASAPDGRLWLAWERDGAINVTRTNRAATRTEPVRQVPSPRRTTAIWRVQGEGSLGPLDLVSNLDAVGGTTLWHQQILPLLSLRITGAAAGVGSARYVFSVSDAGDPIANASVRVGAQTLTTGLAGTVVLTTTDRPLAAFASKRGYATGSATLPRV
jgi:hypothetical protein